VNSTVKLVDSLLEKSSTLVGWSVKWGAGSSFGDVRLVAELVMADAGDETCDALVDWAVSDIELDIG
jgi:hypothetical protein